MAERLVAADASPLIGLAAARGFDLFRRLFGQRASLVESVRPFFERLAAQDFRLSDQLVQAILEQAGETCCDRARYGTAAP